MCTFSANFAFDTATYERTNRHKLRDVVKTDLNVTFEDLFLNAPILATVERERENTQTRIERDRNRRDFTSIYTFFKTAWLRS